MATNFIFPFANLDQCQFTNFLNDENSSPIIPLDILETISFDPFSVQNNPEHPDSVLVQLFPQPFPECKYIHPASHSPVNDSNTLSVMAFNVRGCFTNFQIFDDTCRSIYDHVQIIGLCETKTSLEQAALYNIENFTSFHNCKVSGAGGVYQ